MIGTEIVCNSCQRRWTLPLADSVYARLDLSSRPCPHCEAYTLSYGDGQAPPAPFRQRWRPEQLSAAGRSWSLGGQERSGR
jgi:hypothetical protein